MIGWFYAVNLVLTLFAATNIAMAQPLPGPSTKEQVVAEAQRRLAAMQYTDDVRNVTPDSVLNGSIIKAKVLLIQPDGQLILGAVRSDLIIIHADQLNLDTPTRELPIIVWGNVDLNGEPGLDYGTTCSNIIRSILRAEVYVAPRIRMGANGPEPVPPIENEAKCTQRQRKPDVQITPGARGIDGEDGEPGRPGNSLTVDGRSQMPTVVLSFGKIVTRAGSINPSLVKIHIHLGGIPGGDGGSGGDGQDGGDGAKGIEASNNDVGLCRHGPGRGGNGGNPGRGGRGGNATSGADGPRVVVITNPSTIEIERFFDIRVGGGRPGRPGPPGRVGAVGSGAPRGELVNNCLGNQKPHGGDYRDGEKGNTPKPPNNGAGGSATWGILGKVSYWP